ncbi:hypothetical protein SAMD00019534_080690 [Acytostelium subglobosum LB1]|uniref:hypothetical protein n=1 Tax=Acytostelium subglobosum LB1 TaxID=1410327 RepID=UPI000645225D|nr:hypothetical protein SAMD00019534_080690 [Acytostelium subglobosum LB1]GAM24894.1 hypothetical protein SAMD00019534_080690 [Acytostelium subglobosum LB1]|eukprot:XP_012751983.1 hypothetical protein SAMD00019534_080690 [Acytostelium subglobosum LB1]
MSHNLIDQRLCTAGYIDAWSILGAKIRLDVVRLQDIATSIASTKSKGLFDKFINTINLYHTSSDMATLTNIEWMKVVQKDFSVDERITLESFKSPSVFVSPGQCSRSEDANLCFTIKCVADLPEKFSDQLKEVLMPRPSLQTVINHLRNISMYMETRPLRQQGALLTKIVAAIYKELSQISGLHQPGRLHTIPVRHRPIIDQLYRPLFELFDVPDEYNTERFLLVIKLIEEENRDKPLPKDKLKVVLNLLNDIGQTKQPDIDTFIPDDNGVLCHVSRVLVCKLGDRLSNDLYSNNYRKINDSITPKVACLQPWHRV